MSPACMFLFKETRAQYLFITVKQSATAILAFIGCFALLETTSPPASKIQNMNLNIDALVTGWCSAV